MSWLRWELCKIWKCRVDDELFLNISAVQWDWYATMLVQDSEREANRLINIAEYLASFWNAEAVKKIRDIRDSKASERFASDEEFEKQVLDEEFRKNDELIRSIREKYKNTNLQDNRTRGARETRMPKDMSRLFKMTEEK